MSYEFDVFVSYAHLDDAPIAGDQKGWVAKLHETLERRLAQLLGKSARIWRDPKLKGNDVFDETLVDYVRHAAVLVSVVSPRDVRSEWTARELDEFRKATERQGGIQIKHKSRIFKVLKTPVPIDQQSPPLRSLIGYEFFKQDPESGTFREFDEEFGPEYRQKFLMKLDDLAQDVKALLEFVEGPGLVGESDGDGEGTTIFLAVTTLDLQDQREAIRRDLQQHGHTVLPAREWPQSGADVEAAVREDLARCSMSIHLIGKTYSLTPEGAAMPLAQIENELAIERGAHGGFTRLLWVPPGLQVQDPRQAQLIEHLRTDPRMAQDADLLESPLEDLLTVIQAALDRARARTPVTPPAAGAPTAPGACASVYLVYDQRDAAVVAPLADFLFAQRLDVIYPVFEGDEADVRQNHEESLRTSDAVVIFFGAASEIWLNAKFRELEKIAGYNRTKPAPVVTLCLLPPQTPAKERPRKHEVIVVPQWNGLAPALWQPLIDRFKG